MTLSAAEITRIRQGFGLSRAAFARELGLTGNHQTNFKTMTHLEAGRKPMSLPMARLAWLLSTLPALPEWPDYLCVVDDPEHRP
jgi:DNA-binding transcriptional regulator YiaG